MKRFSVLCLVSGIVFAIAVLAWGQSAKIITNSIGMKFMLIPAGTFQMRGYKVTISKPFYLQTTEVTQGQWQKVMGDNPSHFKECGMDCPVEMVSWDDAQKFIKKLNRIEKTDKYRLPTEAEWVYASRARSATRYYFGDDEAKLKEYAWYKQNSNERTHPVGQLKPNAWGLYDMHGNVCEWCQDWYEKPTWFGRVLAEPVTDPHGPASGNFRVLRGFSWGSDAGDERSEIRSLVPHFRLNFIGFRVAKDF